MIIPAWLAFIIVISIVMIFSKKELSIMLMIGAVIFGILVQINLIESFIAVFADPAIILLAIAVGLIPILGGIMEESGLMMDLIEKMNLSKKTSLMVSPAFFGLLPVAGGALMSAPIVDQIDPSLDPSRKVAINVWFRHTLVIIYPLSPMIILASILAGISIYTILALMVIPSILLALVGYLTILRKLEIKSEQHERDIKKVIHHLIPIVIAPFIDFIGRTFFDFNYPEIYLVIGLCLSIGVALFFSKTPFSNIINISKRLKIWRFSLLIFAIFLFLNVFIKSGLPEDVGALKLPFAIFILLGFFLSFATGRVQVPLSILIPIYLIQYSLLIMPLVDFTFLYCAIFLGYLVTPVHPCVSYSVQYLKANYKDSFKYLAIPTFICLGILFALYALSLLV